MLDEYKYEPDFDRREAILIKIYANINGLTKTYDEQGIASVDDVAEFLTGFNKVFPLCEFIDAGNAKDGADRKIQGKSPVPLLSLLLSSSRCIN